MAQPYQAVLLIAFGGPTSPEEIRPFLTRVTKGARIPPERLESVVRHYEAVGGKSPLNEITFRQAKALQNVLNESGHALPVYVGMRNSQPFFRDTLKKMFDDGIRSSLGFILSSHRTEASWERYQDNVAAARAEIGEQAPSVDYCAAWHNHPRLIQFWTESIEASFAKLASGQRQSTPLIFTAHSLPVAMAARSPYVQQLEETARLIAGELDHDRWSLAYQSRSGGPSDPWLEPDIGEAIQKVASEGLNEVVVAPIGFICDHVEVLYDLDIEARKLAEDLNVRFVRASCPNDHPTFVQMIGDVVEARIRVEDRG
jgi:protoporphyrin/coproporphyrin ferrochelatase